MPGVSGTSVRAPVGSLVDRCPVGLNEIEVSRISLHRSGAGLAEYRSGVEAVAVVLADVHQSGAVVVGIDTASGQHLQAIDGNTAEVVGIVHEEFQLIGFTGAQPGD